MVASDDHDTESLRSELEEMRFAERVQREASR